MQLSETQMKFIRRWGDMGTRWGIPRSTAMLHGLLYVAQAPLAAEEMCELLQLARSNVSTSLKELEGYNLIYRESRAGDRRSFYRAESDVWEMARRILEERRRRGEVFVERPTVRVRLAVALSLTAPVEEQHAVPVPNEHAGVLLRSRPAGEGDDRRTVPRRHVPPVEREPVARRE
jgi:DNA-binding MarR family transcriptional regulator